MSNDNIGRVRRMIDAFNRRSLVVDDFDADVEWIEDARYPGATTYHGPAGVEDSLGKWWDAWAEITMHLAEISGHGDHVIISGETRARGHESDVTVSAPFGGLFEFREGKIVRVQTLSNRA